MVEYATAVSNGIGVAPDEERAAAWFRIAAWRGDATGAEPASRPDPLPSGRGAGQDLVEAGILAPAAAGQGLDE